MKLPEPLENLSKIKHAKIIGLVLTLLLDILLIISVVIIFANIAYFLMMFGLVLVTFIVPYLFGWRDGKQLAVMGIGMFLLIGAINGPIVVHSYYSMDQPEPSSSASLDDWVLKKPIFVLEGGNYTSPDDFWYRLENGNVSIYKGSTGIEYRYTVTYFSNDTAPAKLQMGHARVIQGLEGTYNIDTDSTEQDYIYGKEFHYAMVIASPGIYYHWFSAKIPDSAGGSYSINTTYSLGPLVGSEADNWGTFIPIGALSMFCNIGLLFLIIVLLYWWLGTAKAKRNEWDIALREKEEDDFKKDDAAMDDALESKPFSCDQCGAPVGVEDNFCPKCGERFDGETDESPGAKSKVVKSDDGQPAKAEEP